MSLRSLPQEILDRIIDEAADEAADESLKSLKSLSLTSRYFLQRCRFHIFSRHLISHFISDKAHRILKHNPSLFSNVRKMRMWVWEDPLETTEDHRWELEQISRVLHKLTNLETLSILNVGAVDESSGTQTQAISYLGHFKDAFSRLFASPKLVNIEIDGFNDFPLHLLHSAPALKSLSVRARLSIAEDPQVDSEPKTPWQLTSLIAEDKGLTTIHHLLKSCTNSIYANLVNLQFTIKTVQAHTNAMLIINNAAEYSALEMLDLRYCPPFPSDSDLVYRCYDELIISGSTIPTFPLLHYMKLWIDVTFHRPSFVAPDLAANMIARMLCTNPQPSLKVAHVRFAWGTPPLGPGFNWEQAFIDGLRRGWGSIDDALSDTTRFPKLCAIGMTPVHNFPHPSIDLLSSQDMAIIRFRSKAAIIAAFPQTRAREGMLFERGYDNHFIEAEERILSERHKTHYACWRV
ncbi:hypothetical protein D9611_008223 [Ephemerocybe angulata]|uniref:Uncharacterized protein n=1 Tax=Ephemerocybe angulata TaxID=980116 RepID=A0A8H5F5G2_9AGAR|nr:hypothetical protein D9611_008223 [Tulosesus angulatus]